MVAWALAAALVACSMPVRPAHAAEGLYLTWNDCYLGAHETVHSFACDSDEGEHELYCAFTMPQAADNVVAVEIVVDIQHTSPSLPSWWRFDEGGCRQGNIQATFDFTGKTACRDMWAGGPLPPIGGVADYITSQPRGLPSQARLRVTAAVLQGNAFSLNGSDTYYAARIILKNAGTVTPSCPGCPEPACLVLNSIVIGRVQGTPGGDLFLQAPGAGNANWALWQGSGANCAAVPVRKRAWGEIKSLYR